MHLFVFLFSAALVFLIGTVLIVAFEIADVRFNSWLFLLYSSAITALLGVIFTSLWWSLGWQITAWTALVWLGGLSVLLTVPSVASLKSLMICVVLQVLACFWILYRRSRLPRENRGKAKEAEEGEQHG